MKLFYSVLFLIASLFSYSQSWQNWGCFDSTLVAPTGFCYPEYEPVCACNGKTYMNYCFARNEGYQQYSDGICELIDFHIKSNPVALNLDVEIITRAEGPVTFFIIDWYGKVYYQDFFSQLKRRRLVLPISHLNQGIYAVIAKYEDSEVVVKKFVKVNF